MFLALALLAGLVGASPSAAAGRDYADAALIDGFMKTVFGTEAAGRGSKREGDRVKKWTGAGVRVAIVDLAGSGRTHQVEDFVGVLARTVANLSIETVDEVKAANSIVFIVKRADYASVIRRTLKQGSGVRFLVSNKCSAITGGGVPHVLSRALVFIVADEGDANFRHCMVEEITQSLGPVNDDSSLADSIYNDTSSVETYAIFDWYILNMLYDPRIRPGMTRAEVKSVLPAVLADCRLRLEALRRTGDIDER